MGHQNLGEARDLEVGLAKSGSDIGKITEEGVFHHPDRGKETYKNPNLIHFEVYSDVFLLPY